MMCLANEIVVSWERFFRQMCDPKVHEQSKPEAEQASVKDND